MKRFSEQLYKQSTSVKLQEAEKRELRERLVSYMEYHPLSAEMKAESVVGREVTAIPVSATFKALPTAFLTSFKSSALAAVVMLVVLPFVAEKAIPGDTLYAIKVQFNEELRSTLTFDTYQKVEWEMKLVNRRISEARLLANEGRLTEEVEAEVAQAVKTHTVNAQREIEELRLNDADGATIASIALDTTLEVQSNSLRGVADISLNKSSSTKSQSNLIANVLDESLSLSEANNASSTLPSRSKLMARAEQNTTRVYELLDSVKQSAPAEQLTNVTRRIQDIERMIQSVMELDETNDDEAKLLLVGVIQRTQKLIIYMTELEVTNTVDIESLIPVVLTKTEEYTEVSNLTVKLDQKISLIQEQSVQVKDIEVSKKLAQSLSDLLEQSALAASSTNDFNVFKNIVKGALVIADETLLIIEQYKINEVDVVDVAELSTTTVSDVTKDNIGATSTSETKIKVQAETSSGSKSVLY